MLAFGRHDGHAKVRVGVQARERFAEFTVHFEAESVVFFGAGEVEMEDVPIGADVYLGQVLGSFWLRG
jgi:hypothetical protein